MRTFFYDLIAHLYRQRAWSRDTFGPARKGPARHVTHIRKELREIEESGGMDLVEWIDVVILAFDGAWRHGFTPEQIVTALHEKQIKNEGREWPDWRTVPEDEAIEHVRGDDE